MSLVHGLAPQESVRDSVDRANPFPGEREVIGSILVGLLRFFLCPAPLATR